MNGKKTFYTEFAYLFGITAIALGAALMEAAGFGVSMIVAPAYVVYRKLEEVFSFFTFGMAEYLLQAILLIIMILVLRRFRLHYLFSFVTAVVYGLILDGMMALVGLIPAEQIAVRIVLYCFGLIFCGIGVALVLHTYIAPEVYELIVKEVTAHYHISVTKFKTCYDCGSCLVAILLSFLFFGFGNLVGIGVGTVVCALINGWLIDRFSKLLERHFEFKDALKRSTQG